MIIAQEQYVIVPAQCGVACNGFKYTFTAHRQQSHQPFGLGLLLGDLTMWSFLRVCIWDYCPTPKGKCFNFLAESEPEAKSKIRF